MKLEDIVELSQGVVADEPMAYVTWGAYEALQRQHNALVTQLQQARAWSRAWKRAAKAERQRSEAYEVLYRYACAELAKTEVAT
jgi:hypothetical protein